MDQRATAEKRHGLIEEYREYVHYVVAKMMQFMKLPTESYEEFIAAGYLGLVEAAERFDATAGYDFKSFAYLRIRGAVIDSIRECSELTGAAYRCARVLQAMQMDREQQLILAGDEHPAEQLAEIVSFVARGGIALRLALSDAELELCETLPDPEAQLSNKQQCARFRSLVALLPDKERMVIQEHYFNGKSFTQIAAEQQGISKSWISRLHTRALNRLRELGDEAF